MKKIISFGLWGENPRYTIGALKNADLTFNFSIGYRSPTLAGNRYTAYQFFLYEKVQINFCHFWVGGCF